MNSLDNIYIGNLLEEKECSINETKTKYYEVVDTPLFIYLNENNQEYVVLLSGLLMGEKVPINSVFLANIKSLSEIFAYQREFDLNSIIRHYQFSVGNFYTKSVVTNNFILIRDAQKIMDIVNNREEQEGKIISLSKYQNVIRPL